MGPLGRLPLTIHITHRFITGPPIEDTLSATDEAGLGTSAALDDQIDKRKLKLSKQNLAHYVVCLFN